MPARSAPKPPPPAARPPATRSAAADGKRSDARGGRSDGGAGAELRRTGDQAGGNGRTEDPEPEQREAGEDEAHRLAEVGLLAARAPTNSPKKPEPMPTITASTITLMPEVMTLPSTRSARKAGAVPERERHQHEAGKGGQLELDDGDEELDREDEEGDDHEQPGDQQDDDRQEIVEEGGEAEHLARLVEQRPGRLEPGPGKVARAAADRRRSSSRRRR